MAVILRIFSGLHLGAEIELTNGLHVIGKDDSCDLILSDSSLYARHAALRISDEGGTVRVSAEALDGPIVLDGTPVHDESDLPSGTPFQLGLLIAAWLPADVPDQANAWASVVASLERKTADTAPAPVSSEPSPGATPAAPSSTIENGFDNSTLQRTDESDDGTNVDIADASVTASKSPHRIRDFGLIAAIILAGSLCFSWNSNTETAPELTMRTLLDEAGYHALQVSAGRDNVIVTGRIATDRERGRLLRLAQMLPFPVYLDVTVRSDVADAVRASFNTLSLWPEVTELPPSARPGIRVRGYIKNGVLEQQALSHAMRNVPALRVPESGGKAPLEIFREIKHEEDVQAVLAPALTLAGLNDLQCTFHPGRVELHGSLTPQSKTALEDVAKTVEAQLGVPIPFDIINDAEVQTQKTNIYVDQRSPDSRKSVKKEEKAAESFKIISVSMGVMKFVTLENGERVFEGGELPGGFVLEHIDVDKLTLKKNGSSTLYPLRESNE